MGVVGNCRIFRRHAEGVPTHGVKDIEPAHPFVTGHHVSDGIISHMSHVDLAGGIGKHFQQVVFFLIRHLDDIEQSVILPPILPLGFDCLGMIP